MEARVEFLIEIGLHMGIRNFKFNFCLCWTFLIYRWIMFSFLLSAYQFLNVFLQFKLLLIYRYIFYRNGIQFMVDKYNSSSINTQATIPIWHKYAYTHTVPTQSYAIWNVRKGRLTRIPTIPVDFTRFKCFFKISTWFSSSKAFKNVCCYCCFQPCTGMIEC